MICRSFKEYVSQTLYDEIDSYIEKHIADNFDSFESDKLHKIGNYEVTHTEILHVWVEDLPNIDIGFDVLLSAYIILYEGNYHYDNYDEKIICFKLSCTGKDEVYVGITKQDLEKRKYQHNKGDKNFEKLKPIKNAENLTRNQARAIEQYYIEKYRNKKGKIPLNKINSISPNNIHYDDAIKWAKNYLGVD